MHARLTRSTLMALERAMWVAGLSLLFAYALNRAWSAYAAEAAVEAMQRAQHVQALSASVAPRSSPAIHIEPDTSSWSAKRLAEYRAARHGAVVPLAVLRVPPLKLSVPIFEGTTDATLNAGAGRIEGTAAFGQSGNIGIAAHRDGFVRPLQDIKLGDFIYLDRVTESREYRVTRIHIVEPIDVSVLEATTKDTITLVTCYPFYFVGSAPLRFIVRAERVPDTKSASKTPLRF
jgi:sortase A